MSGSQPGNHYSHGHPASSQEVSDAPCYFMDSSVSITPKVAWSIKLLILSGVTGFLLLLSFVEFSQTSTVSFCCTIGMFLWVYALSVVWVRAYTDVLASSSALIWVIYSVLNWKGSVDLMELGGQISRDMVCMVLIMLMGARSIVQANFSHVVAGTTPGWHSLLAAFVFDPRNGQVLSYDNEAGSEGLPTPITSNQRADMAPTVLGVLAFLTHLGGSIVAPVLLALPLLENNLVHESGWLSCLRASLFFLMYLVADKLFQPREFLRGRNAVVLFAGASYVFFVHRFLLPVACIHLVVLFIVFVRFTPEGIIRASGSRMPYMMAAVDAD